MSTSPDLKEHYRLLLGLDKNWEVERLDLQMAARQVRIDLRHASGVALASPQCQNRCIMFDHAPERERRHLDTMRFETVLRARVPRCQCADCGVKTIAVPWAGKHSPFKWLRTHGDKRSSEAVSFRALHQLDLKTSRAWHYKEDFWNYRSPEAALRFYEAWRKAVMRSRLEPLKKIVRMIDEHWREVLNYVRRHITNAVSEGLNSRIQAIKSAALPLLTTGGGCAAHRGDGHQHGLDAELVDHGAG